MPISLEEDTEVITSDGKKIGKVKTIENEDYFIVSKKGLLTDEEIRVPVTAILARKGDSADNEPIRLNMSEETLKHGKSK
jgi:sporulation protein YlmC with PRC-barrel domain